MKAERSAIIQYTERKLKLQVSNPGNTNSIAAQLAAMKEAEASNLLEIEIKRMEALKKRQEKEMNKMIEKEKQSAGTHSLTHSLTLALTHSLTHSFTIKN